MILGPVLSLVRWAMLCTTLTSMVCPLLVEGESAAHIGRLAWGASPATFLDGSNAPSWVAPRGHPDTRLPGSVRTPQTDPNMFGQADQY